MKREDVKTYISHELRTFDYADDYIHLDSMDKIELVIRCENEYDIQLDDDQVAHDWTTEFFVDFVFKSYQLKYENKG